LTTRSFGSIPAQVGAIAIFLVIGNRIIQSGQNDRRKQLARALALFEVEGSAVNEIGHHAS
jgi:hypothetical protein